MRELAATNPTFSASPRGFFPLLITSPLVNYFKLIVLFLCKSCSEVISSYVETSFIFSYSVMDSIVSACNYF